MPRVRRHHRPELVLQPGSQKATSGVLLVDDHVSFRSALATLLDLETDLEVVAQTGSIAETRAALPGIHPDIALVALDLTDGDGLELIPDLVMRNPEMAVVILASSARPQTKALAVASGATGLLHKMLSVGEIIQALRKVAAGQALIPPDEIPLLVREATRYQAKGMALRQALEKLTPRERDVLRELARGLDNQAIADHLCVSTATVRTHVVQLLRKLQVESRLQAALIAVRLGLIDDEELP